MNRRTKKCQKKRREKWERETQVKMLIWEEVRRQEKKEMN